MKILLALLISVFLASAVFAQTTFVKENDKIYAVNKREVTIEAYEEEKQMLEMDKYRAEEEIARIQGIIDEIEGLKKITE